MTIIQITDPSPRGFTAGLEFQADGIVIRTAPILAYMMGWTRQQVLNYVHRRDWKLYPFDEEHEHVSRVANALGDKMASA